jgi:hypothetical protein
VSSIDIEKKKKKYMQETSGKEASIHGHVERRGQWGARVLGPGLVPVWASAPIQLGL